MLCIPKAVNTRVIYILTWQILDKSWIRLDTSASDYIHKFSFPHEHVLTVLSQTQNWKQALVDQTIFSKH